MANEKEPVYREVSELEFTLGVNMLVSETGANVNPYELRNAAILQEKKRAILYRNGHTVKDATGRALEAEAAKNIQHSRKLGDNMRKARPNDKRPPNTDAHHIVSVKHPAAERARAILFRNGIGINDADNGVYLPSKNDIKVKQLPNAHPHKTVHTATYYLNTARDLGEAESEIPILDITRELQQSERGGEQSIRETLRYIADDLQDGTYPIR